MILTGRRPTFRKQKASDNPYRVVALLALLIAGLFLLRSVEREEIKSPFAPTLVPTRPSASFSMEAETRFQAGDLNGAIQAYQEAVKLEPENARLWVDLARVQTYSSAMLSTDSMRAQRLKEALASAEEATRLAPDDSAAFATYAFVLSWYASPALVGENWQNMLAEAEQAAVRAIQLDNQNTLALAYYAEILMDQQRLLQAEQYIKQALERDPSLMDVHRVNAYVQESMGDYGAAIKEYQTAAEITPNLTFLYIRIGVNYRQLKRFEQALEYFAKAANINEQIGIKDPYPYLAIGKTYSQMGEFFIAARNVEKVLSYDPFNPDTYATLGMIYFKSRNYESAILALKCATYGCPAIDSCTVREGDPSMCDTPEEISNPVPIEGMKLSANTLVYYYTYGSVLAGMHQPSNNYCEEAMKVLGEVREQYSSDTATMQIVESSENICASFGYSRK